MGTNSYRVALADRLLKYAFVEAIADLDSAQWADFKALIQKALRDDGPSMRWIPVTERLPENNHVVIVSGGIARWRDPCPEWPDGQFFTLTGERWPGLPIQWEVTHWMPLPAQPSSDATHGEGSK